MPTASRGGGGRGGERRRSRIIFSYPLLNRCTDEIPGGGTSRTIALKKIGASFAPFRVKVRCRFTDGWCRAPYRPRYRFFFNQNRALIVTGWNQARADPIVWELLPRGFDIKWHSVSAEPSLTDVANGKFLNTKGWHAGSIRA